MPGQPGEEGKDHDIEPGGNAHRPVHHILGTQFEDGVVEPFHKIGGLYKRHNDGDGDDGEDKLQQIEDKEGVEAERCQFKGIIGLGVGYSF